MEENQLRTIQTLINGNKSAMIMTDGGRYQVTIFEDGTIKNVAMFNEHTLRIVENYAKEAIK